MILANEVSSTLSIYQINNCAFASGAIISSSDPVICQGESIQLTLNTTPNFTYQWIRDSQVLTNQNGSMLTTNQAGNYKVAISNSTLACVDTSSVFVVIVNALPSVSAGNNQTICGGLPVTLTAIGATNYTWNNGTTNAELVVNTGETASTSVYTVTGINSSTSCANTAQVLVIVQGLPNVEAGLSQLVCADEAITLTATGAVSYTWNNGISNSVSFLQSSENVTYSVIGTDVNNCSNEDSVTVIVNALPIVSAGNNIEVCANAIPIKNGCLD